MPAEIPPAATGRLFPEVDDASTLGPNPFVIGRLLEDGDRRDLAWLVAAAGPERLRDWLETRGERQLSRRSRAFWSLILGVEGADEDNALWPL